MILTYAQSQITPRRQLSPRTLPDMRVKTKPYRATCAHPDKKNDEINPSTDPPSQQCTHLETPANFDLPPPSHTHSPAP